MRMMKATMKACAHPSAETPVHQNMLMDREGIHKILHND